jgi:GT2 family glycosyltransferase
MLALLCNISKLEEKDRLLQEIIVVNNKSTEDYSAVESFVKENPQLPIQYIFSNENLGVAKGRNFAITHAQADVLVMLDDDAELENTNALVAIEKTFAENPDIAIASFKVKYYSTLAMQVNAFPHKKFSEKQHLHFFETYYFAGGAHAIKKKAMEAVGGYPTDFFYGMEEYDLSYKLLDQGYKIIYTDTIVMLHKESLEGRPAHKEKMKMLWLNKSKVAWRYLPISYFISTAAMWSFEYLRKSKFDFWGFLNGWRYVFQSIMKETRKPLKQSTLAYLKTVDARLWY